MRVCFWWKDGKFYSTFVIVFWDWGTMLSSIIMDFCTLSPSLEVCHLFQQGPRAARALLRRPFVHPKYQKTALYETSHSAVFSVSHSSLEQKIKDRFHCAKLQGGRSSNPKLLMSMRFSDDEMKRELFLWSRSLKKNLAYYHEMAKKCCLIWPSTTLYKVDKQPNLVGLMHSGIFHKHPFINEAEKMLSLATLCIANNICIAME